MTGVSKCPTCGKNRYTSRTAARRALKQAGNRVRVYPCAGYWHVTDQERGR